VTKLNASGSKVAYSTFLGGTSSDVGQGIAVYGSGRAYVTGYTSSADYPTTRGAFDRTFNEANDAFVTKLPTG
jgi:Ca2+-binding RTX toxin-like protein